MDTEAQLMQNAQDISKLAGTVDKLAYIVDQEAQRAKEDRGNLQDVVNELRTLNKQVGSISQLQTDITACNGEIGKLRHDLRNAENSIGAIPALGEKITGLQLEINTEKGRVDALKEHQNKYDMAKMCSSIETLERERNERAGAVKAIDKGGKIFWTLFGGIIMSICGSVITWYVTSHQPPQPSFSQTTTIERKGNQHVITGD